MANMNKIERDLDSLHHMVAQIARSMNLELDSRSAERQAAEEKAKAHWAPGGEGYNALHGLTNEEDADEMTAEEQAEATALALEAAAMQGAPNDGATDALDLDGDGNSEVWLDAAVAEQMAEEGEAGGSEAPQDVPDAPAEADAEAEANEGKAKSGKKEK
jgi:hypothetical protein